MSSVLNHWQFMFLVSISLPLAFLHLKVLAQREGDLRLAGYGASRLAGRLEIFLNGEWGTVCSPRDTLDVTKVACRQLGLGHFVGHVPGSSSLRYGLGNGAIWLEDVSCRGDDLHLLRCDKPHVGSLSCDHHMDISVMCSGILTPYEGEVRLVGGAYASEGVVQINLHHTWSTVCSTDMEPGLATSICRQLGYTRALRSVQQATNVTGQFLQLPSSTQCSVSSYPCIQSCLPDLLSSPSSSSCSGDGLSPWSVTCGISESEFGNATSGSATDCAIHSTQAEEYEVRLHGNHPDHGRVEVYVEGQWSTVQELRDEEATVICKQLGFPNFLISLTSSDSTITELDLEPVPGSQVRLFCTGLETHVNGCSFSSPDVTDHSTDAYIYCSPILWPFGSLQLVGGAGPFGQLLVSPRHDFQWLCDAHFTMAEAEVACRQMGYANAIRVVENSLLSDYPNASLLHYSLLCSGDEDYLLACQRRSLVNEYCRDNLDFVAIQCGSSSSTGGWRVRLTPVAADNDGIHNDSRRGNVSRGAREGRVEVRLEEGREWGGVCADEFLDLSAHVVCRQLGFETYSSVAVVESGGDHGTGHLTSVQCTGFEDLLDYCPHSLATTNCSHLVTINCSDVLPYPDGLLRLVNTSATSTSPQATPPSEGRLEVSYHGLWMSVCGRLFSQEAANVACRQLGFEAPANYCINGCFGQGTSDIHFGEYSCHGNESSVLDCGVNIHNREFCSHDYDVGLSCSPVRSVGVVVVPSSTAASSSSLSLPLPSLSSSISASLPPNPTNTDRIPRDSVTPAKDNPFISDGIIYVLAVVLCLLFLSLIFSVTICCVVRKKRDSWVLQAPNGSYSDRNVAAIGEGTDNGGVSLQEVMERQGDDSPDFDFDAMADEVAMKACVKEAEAMTVSPGHTSLTSSSGLPPQYHELEFLSHSIPGEETKNLD